MVFRTASTLQGQFRWAMLVSVAAFAAGCPIFAQCPFGWRPGEGHPGVTGDLPVWTMTVWDPDGRGPAEDLLIAAGGFLGAGNIPSFGIAQWDGEKWAGVGNSQLTNQIFASVVYNGDLIVAGDFQTVAGLTVNRIARWDGNAWHAMGSGFNNSVRAVAVYNGDLYAGGFFTHAGGTPANGIARWNGSAWQSLGGNVNCVATELFPWNGSLVVAGNFTSGVPATRVARWNGSTWQSMDPGPGETMSTADAFGEYHGQLIMGANIFSLPGGQFLRSISQWTGSSWQGIGGMGPNDNVNAILEYDGDLYVAGAFTSASGVSVPNRIAKWDGQTWSDVPAGPSMPARRGHSLAIYKGDLIAGGLASTASGEQTSAIGRFDGITWHAMGGGINSVVVDIESLNGHLYVGGWFTSAGDIQATAIARKRPDGTWDGLPGGISGDCCGNGTAVGSMAVLGDSLIVSGSFTHAGGIPVPGIAQWADEQWLPFGLTHASGLTAIDGELYGIIQPAPGSVQVARWFASNQNWMQIGQMPVNFFPFTLASFNGELIAGGLGGSAISSVYRFDEDAQQWQPIGTNFGFNSVEALAVYDNQLIAGILLNNSGPASCVMGWNETAGAWQPLGSGVGGWVWDMTVYNGELIIGGELGIGQPEFERVAKWNGTSWSAFGPPFSGPNAEVLALGKHGNDLVLGGWFVSVGNAPNGHLARWGPNCPGDVNLDGVVNVNDLLAVINQWGVCPAAPLSCTADIAPPPSGDGAVNVNDLLLVINNWG